MRIAVFTNCDASRDVAGDRKEGIPTMPVTYGIPLTSKLVALTWALGVLLSFAFGVTTGLGYLYFGAVVIAGAWMLLQAVDFMKNPTVERGTQIFYQGANYRAILFSVLIVDVLFRAVVAGYPGVLG